MRFLIIEPFPGMRVIIRGILQSMGMDNVQDAPDIVRGCAILLDTPIDFIICAQNVMPIAGDDFAKALRWAKDSPNREVRYALLHSSEDVKEVDKIYDCGVDVIVDRPFSISSLQAKLKRVFAKRPGFVECKSYVGPDRRRQESPKIQGDRRHPHHNPGAADYQKKLLDFIDEALGASVDSDPNAIQLHQIDINISNLTAGHVLAQNIETKRGVTLLSKGDVLSEKHILKLKDLLAAEMIAPKAWIKR